MSFELMSVTQPRPYHGPDAHTGYKVEAPTVPRDLAAIRYRNQLVAEERRKELKNVGIRMVEVLGQLEEYGGAISSRSLALDMRNELDPEHEAAVYKKAIRSLVKAGWADLTVEDGAQTLSLTTSGQEAIDDFVTQPELVFGKKSLEKLVMSTGYFIVETIAERTNYNPDYWTSTDSASIIPELATDLGVTVDVLAHRLHGLINHKLYIGTEVVNGSPVKCRVTQAGFEYLKRVRTRAQEKENIHEVGNSNSAEDIFQSCKNLASAVNPGLAIRLQERYESKPLTGCTASELKAEKVYYSNILKALNERYPIASRQQAA